MANLPVPFKILKKISSLRTFFEKNKVKHNGDIEILIGGREKFDLIGLNDLGHLLISGPAYSKKNLLPEIIIQSLISSYTPDEVRLIISDSKTDLVNYQNSPYLLTDIIIGGVEKSISALKWLTFEMDSRYKEFMKIGSANLIVYNQQAKEKKPRIIYFINNLDQIISASHESIEMIDYLVDCGRVPGIHLILSASNLTRERIPTKIRTNIPYYAIFKGTTVRGMKNLNNKDVEKLKNTQFILYSEKVPQVVDLFQLEDNGERIKDYFQKYFPQFKSPVETSLLKPKILSGEEDLLLPAAIDIIMQFDKVSASLLQRRLSIGYARAARILDQLEAQGFIGPAEGARPREVLKK